MSLANQLLTNQEVIEYINPHLDSEDRIKRAAEELAGKPDALKALKKLLPALSQDKINVFFSYKKKDEDAARTIVEALRSKSAGKLLITYQAEFTKKIAGIKWRASIRDAIHRGNWFILLFPDPSDDWDWCLFETGLFEAQLTSADRLICLHHPDTKIPSPIEGYHAVAATIPEVEEFLEMIFLNDNPVPGMKSLNKFMSQTEISMVAREIVDAIRRLPICLVRQIYEPWIELKIDNEANLQNKDDLDEAIVMKSNNEALNLFDFIQKPKSWGELRSGLPERKDDERWREELFHVIRKIANGRKFTPIQAVFQTNDNRRFRPVACAVDRVGSDDGPIAVFHITFTEDVATVDVSSTPKNISVLAAYLRFAYRHRWEVLEKFGTGPISEDDVDRLYNTLERIRTDARSRDIVGVDAILDFFSPEQARKIINIYRAWYQITNPEQNGQLDIAIKKKQTEKISEILARFIPSSQEFLELAANRFSELVKE